MCFDKQLKLSIEKRNRKEKTYRANKEQMNVVDFFKRKNRPKKNGTTITNGGFCFEFDAPLTDSGINESQMQTDPDDCCPVKVFITNLSERKNRLYNNTTNLLQNYTIDYTFTLHVLAFDRIDTNVFAEQLGHPISESKWETILRPLQECVCEEGNFRIL